MVNEMTKFDVNDEFREDHRKIRDGLFSLIDLKPKNVKNL